MADTTDTNLQIVLQETGGNDNTWGEVANANFQKLINAITETQAISVTGGDKSLTDDEQRPAFLNISGTLTSNQTVKVNDTGKKLWFVYNGTSGSFTLTVQTESGTGVAIPQGQYRLLFADGTNVVELKLFDRGGALSNGYVGEFTETDANTLTATLDDFTDSALKDGMFIWGRKVTATTDDITFDLNTIGATAIKDGDNEQIRPGAITANSIIGMIYNADFTAWQLVLNVSGSGGADLKKASTITSSQAISEADNGKLFFIDASSNAITLTVDDITAFANGWNVRLFVIDATNDIKLLETNGLTVNGAPFYRLDAKYQGALVQTDGATLQVVGDAQDRVTNKRLASMTAKTVKGSHSYATGTMPANPFTTVSSSAVVTVDQTAHGRTAGDNLVFSGATAVGGITVDGEYTVTAVVDDDQYTITHSSNATGSATGGGSSVVYTYEEDPRDLVLSGAFQSSQAGLDLKDNGVAPGKIAKATERYQILQANADLDAIWAAHPPANMNVRIQQLAKSNRGSGGQVRAVLGENNVVYVWGDSTYQATGLALTTYPLYEPQRIQLPVDETVTKLVQGNSCFFAVMSSGKCYSWGRNDAGQLGHANQTDTFLPTLVVGSGTTFNVVDVVTPTQSNDAVNQFTFFIADDGDVYSCGKSTDGILGHNAGSNITTPTIIPSLSNASKISASDPTNPHAIAVLTDGTIRSWGSNTEGQLGDGTTADKTTPVQPSGITDVSEVVAASGYDGTGNEGFSMLLKTDGTLMMCGSDHSSQQGSAGGGDSSSFTTLSVDSKTVTQIAAIGGRSGTCFAVTSDKNLYGWGDNVEGVLGLGDFTDRNVPTKLSTNFDGKVKKVRLGGNYNAVAKAAVTLTDDTMVAAGRNENSNLGTNDTAARVETWQEIEGAVAEVGDFDWYGDESDINLMILYSDGQVLITGKNTKGALGMYPNNEAFTAPRPLQIPSFTRAANASESLVPIRITIGAAGENLTTGTGKYTFRMPYAAEVKEVRASVSTAPTGADIQVDINEGGTSILSSVLTIDATEKTSETSASPAAISDAQLADDAEISVDIDQVGSTVAGQELQVTLLVNRVL